MQERLVLEDPLLGSPVAEYRRSLRTFLILHLSYIGVFCYFAWRTTQQTIYDPNVVLIFIVFSLLIAGLIIFALLRSERRVILCENGLRTYYLTRTEEIFWKDIETIQNDSIINHGAIVVWLTICCSNGRKHRYAGYLWKSNRRTTKFSSSNIRQIQVDELATYLFDVSRGYRLEKILYRYDTGERISFGKFQLCRDGIHVKNKTLLWQDVQDIHTDGEILMVKRIGYEKPWSILSLAQTPNEDLIFTVIAYGQRKRHSAFQPAHLSREISKLQNRRTWLRRFMMWVAFPILAIAIPIGIHAMYYPISAQSKYDRGYNYYQMENFVAAAQEFTHAIDQNPYMVDWYIDRGMAYHRLNEFDKALADYAMALQLEPDHRRAIVHRGRVFYRRGEYHQAIADYDYVIAQHPTYYYAYCTRAFSYKQLGKIQKAIVDFTACHDLTTLERWKIRANEEIQALQFLAQ